MLSIPYGVIGESQLQEAKDLTSIQHFLSTCQTAKLILKASDKNPHCKMTASKKAGLANLTQRTPRQPGRELE